MNKLLKVFIVLTLLLNLVSCKKKEEYLVDSYLIYLANRSGISNSFEIEEVYDELIEWKIVSEEDRYLLDSQLKGDFVLKTIRGFDYLEDIKVNEDELVFKEKAEEIVDKVVSKINNPEYRNRIDKEEKHDVISVENASQKNNILYSNQNLNIGDYIYIKDDNVYRKVIGKEGNKYYLEDLSIDDVFSKLKISGSSDINLENAIISDYSESEDLSYRNNKFNLLASTRKSFTKEGFNISYSLKSSGLDIRITKDTKDGLNAYFDASLSNIKPTYDFDYEKGKINHAFFKIDYKLTNKLGISDGKRDKVKLDFSNLDKSSLMDLLKSTIKKDNSELESTIPICEIKTPMPELPSVYLNIDVVAKLYATGRIEIVLYNSSSNGFEVKDGKLRLINDNNRDLDFIIGASVRSTVGLNFNLEAASIRLMDIELDGGIRAAVSTTLHIYDKEGVDQKVEVDLPYSTVDDIAKNESDIKVCGDVSLNWVLDININTSKSLLYKFGLTKSLNILDDKNQILGNKTHIENFQFVSKCTRKNKVIVQASLQNIDSNKISLEKYSLVIVIAQSQKVPIKSLPKGYTNNDLVISSKDTEIVEINDGTLYAKNIGSTEITIKTKDNKYEAYLSVLVSTG